MALNNTLIIDPSDQDLEQKFKDFVEDEQTINFIVLGDDANANTLVGKADTFSLGHSGKIERKVAWIKDHQTLRDLCIEYVSTFPDYDSSKYDQTLGFTLSPKFHECKYVFMDGDVLDNFSVSRAFWKASLRERSEA